MEPKNEQPPGLAPGGLGSTNCAEAEDTRSGATGQARLAPIDSLTSDDLLALAALRRQEEERRQERFWDMLDQPALGSFRRSDHDPVDWRSWSRPVPLERIKAVAEGMASSGWPAGVVARALLVHAAQSGWSDLRLPTRAIKDGLRSGQVAEAVSA